MPLDGDSKFKNLKVLCKGTELAGKTIGIIGFGRIDRSRKIAIGVQMNVIFYDKFIQEADLKLDFFDGQILLLN